MEGQAAEFTRAYRYTSGTLRDVTGAELRELRQGLDITQAELAERLGSRGEHGGAMGAR